MSIKYKIENEKIELILEGTFSVDDMINKTQEALSQTRTLLPILVDASNSIEIKSEEELKIFVEFICRNKNKIVLRIAIFVDHILRYGTARQIGAYFEMSGIESEAFYNRNDAIKWLLDDNKKDN